MPPLLSTIPIIRKFIRRKKLQTQIQRILRTQLSNSLTKRTRRPRALQRKQIRSETSDVRSRHGSARNGVGVGIAVDPRGSNVGTRSENVHEKAEVGVGGSSVVFVAGADGADFGGGGR